MICFHPLFLVGSFLPSFSKRLRGNCYIGIRKGLGLGEIIRRAQEGGMVSLEPQPFLQCSKAAPKSQWVMVVALWYRPSDWLEGLRPLRGRFEGKGAVGGMSPFPVADSPETTPPVPGFASLWMRPKGFIRTSALKTAGNK